MTEKHIVLNLSQPEILNALSPYLPTEEELSLVETFTLVVQPPLTLAGKKAIPAASPPGTLAVCYGENAIAIARETLCSVERIHPESKYPIFKASTPLLNPAIFQCAKDQIHELASQLPESEQDKFVVHFNLGEMGWLWDKGVGMPWFDPKEPEYLNIAYGKEAPLLYNGKDTQMGIVFFISCDNYLVLLKSKDFLILPGFELGSGKPTINEYVDIVLKDLGGKDEKNISLQECGGSFVTRKNKDKNEEKLSPFDNFELTLTFRVNIEEKKFLKNFKKIMSRFDNVEEAVKSSASFKGKSGMEYLAVNYNAIVAYIDENKTDNHYISHPVFWAIEKLKNPEICVHKFKDNKLILF